MQNNQKELILLEDLGMLYPTNNSTQISSIKRNNAKSCGCIKNKFRARISQNYKFIHLGYFINIKDAVFARNTYILENKLEHKISIIEEN